MTENPTKPGKQRWMLLLLVAVCAAPILASYLTYYFWKPQGGRTYGELLEVKPVPAFPQQTLEGKPAGLADFKGKWVLVMSDDVTCAKSCMDALFAMRQFRLGQGKEMERVTRLWLVRGEGMPSSAAVSAADGATIHRIGAEAVPLPGDVNAGIYLIDPLGNQVIRYPRSADGVKVIREIAKFLKNNVNIG
ncbi:cytochrome C oxidase subunit I [Chitinimonas sp. BJYL2]|uniref:cytochrome C oxidase subunit I n=1 Tax=Chitinimonas sp. BJYL2 TaxID=2976696 RepID=UPI0022B40322|nr:cytochrome C oxidase subunit I [Chitinimonas sp. BJYL2]